MTPERVTLLVASTGGHLEELARLARRFDPPTGPVEWVTFDDEQSRSLLAGAAVHTIAPMAPRDGVKAVKALRDALHIVRPERVAKVVSTGAAPAVPFLLAASMRGIPGYYVESAARGTGPSLTGRLASHTPKTHLYTQHSTWAGARWRYAGSLFDDFAPGTSPGGSAKPAAKVVVTLGTMRNYGFRRAVQALVRTLPEVCTPDAQILWQTGFTDVSGFAIQGRKLIPAAELTKAIMEADLVVSHAGVGSALSALDAGRLPVLLPRLRKYAEHVDDHQLSIASDLQTRGLAVSRDPDLLRSVDLVAAMSSGVSGIGAAQPFRLRDYGLDPVRRTS